MITVTRQDLTMGYQAVQSVHALSQFAYEYPEVLKEWHENNNYLVCLAVKTLEDLNELANKLEELEVKFTKFYEDDIEEVTALCIEPSEKARKLTSGVSLVGKVTGNINKHCNTKSG